MLKLKHLTQEACLNFKYSGYHAISDSLAFNTVGLGYQGKEQE